MILILTLILNPLVISYQKYIYTGSILCVFIRVWLTSSILVTPDFEHSVKCYPVSWFSWTLNIKWFIRASWRTRNSNRVRRQSLRQAPGFLNRGPRLVVPSCRGCLQKHSNHTVKNQIWSHHPEASPNDYGLGMQPDHGFCCLLRNPLGGFKGQACLLIYSIKPSKGLQTNSSPWAGRPLPYCSHRRHVGPSPRGWETRLPVPRFISGKVAPQDEGPSPRNSKTLVKRHYTPIVCGTPGKLYLPTTSWPQHRPHRLPRHVVDPRTAEAHHRTAVAKPQVHQNQSVGSTKVLVLQPTTVALLAVSRETPEPAGRGKIKQPSRWRLSCVPSRCPVEPWLFSWHQSVKICISSSFLSCTDRPPTHDGWWTYN